MKKTFAIFCAALLMIGAASPGSFAIGKKRVKNSPAAGLRHIESSFHLYDSLQKRIWNYAETCYKEVRSAEQWASYLESCGFTVERGAGGIPTAFVASYGAGSPVIGIMAEYDALAGMSQDTVPYRKPLIPGANGHGCGHNLLGTGSVAGAVAASKWLAEGHRGTIKLFGCPAEEGGGGKAYMMRAGVFEGLDAMLDWHPDTRNTVNKASGLANVQVEFTFRGRSSHASGAPEEGRSALDAVEALDYMINMMREHVPQTSRIHYVITDGGKAPNVVPDKASVRYYFRSPSREVVGQLLERALDAARGAALGTGTTMDYELMSGNYERLPNEAMAALVGRSLETVGGIKLDAREMEFAREVASQSGVDASLIDRLGVVVPPADEGYEAYVSSDVGNVTWAVPTGSFRYACFTPGGVGHSWQQVSSAGTTIGTKGALGAARVLFLSAYELYTKPEVLASVREEFESRRGPGFTFRPLMGSRRPPFEQPASLAPEMPPVQSFALKAPAAIESIPDQSRRLLSESGAAMRADTLGLDVFLPASGITDQAGSGRCWYFSTANVLRGGRHFSTAYGYFYDMLEKANLFLVNIWEHRKEPLDSRFNETLLRRPTWDGGQFMNALYLIDKYGIVPQEAMPDTETALNSGPLLASMRTLLRSYALRLRESSDPEAVRAEALSEAWKLLSRTLGTPPERFTLEGREWTPLEWRDALGLGDLKDRYVILMNDPTRPYGKVYRVQGSRSAADAPEWTFLNLSAEDLEVIGMRSLRASRKFYFTVDTYKDALADEGIYDTRLAIEGAREGEAWHMSKEQLFLSRDVSSAHAMAMCGVQTGADGKVVRWVAENSFGLSRGQDGYIQMEAAWWRRYMFRMAVEKECLSEQQLKLAGGTPELIPYWNLY
ncbi:MAG: amidohydrolase [Bacteroidales bacterium]|nr:amidohydrolase [Bacteroidales bacterium]